MRSWLLERKGELDREPARLARVGGWLKRPIGKELTVEDQFRHFHPDPRVGEAGHVLASMRRRNRIPCS